MKLKRFQIEGYRRILDTTIFFSDASFIIGENNVGKSAVLLALEIFHSGIKKLDTQDFFFDEKHKKEVDHIILTAEYGELPENSNTWRGFKGRILKKEENGEEYRYIIYRKTFEKSGRFIPEMKVYKKTIKNEFENCKNVQEFIDAGLSIQIIKDVYGDIDKNSNLTTKGNLDKLELIEEIWEIDDKHEEWVKNPGGIQGNITIKLPRFLMIPAEDRKNDVDGKSGALQKTMMALFKEVREASDNYKKAQEYLDKLAEELDPKDKEKEFGKMMDEINSIVSNIFPETELHVETQLDDADTVLKPQFLIEMSSNIKTLPERQGTGAVRSAAFALLRYREQFLEKRRAQEKEEGKDISDRNLIIGFEEPEMYLHPNAANNMRDEIYNLAISSNSQMICTTHSPYMIDLSKDLDKSEYPHQVLNLFRLILEDDLQLQTAKGIAFNVTKAYKELVGDEKDYIKFILKMDDYVARVFFAKKIIIVEGDTEEIILRETIKRMPNESKKIVQSNYQIIKARGKAAIIALIKYLKSMEIQPYVIHDLDELEGATKFNEPIKNALGGGEFRIMLENCIEDVLNYKIPSSNKPFNAYKYIAANWELEKGWDGVQDNWKEIIKTNIFKDAFQPN